MSDETYQDELDDDIRIEHLKYVEQRCMEFGMWGPPLMMVHAALKLAQDELESGARETIDSLTAENRALQAELRMARGEVKTVLNNCEAAKIKAERMRDEYTRRLEQPAEDFWKREVELARKTADYYKDGYHGLCQVLLDIQKIARERKHYELKEVDDDR